MGRLRVVLIAAVVGGLAVREGAAQSPAERAEKLAQAGELLFDAGKYSDALRQFLDAHALFDPPDFVIPEVLWNIGRCYEETGDDEQALRYFQEFLGVAATPEYREVAERKIAAVRQRRMAEWEVRIEPPSAEVLLDGEVIALPDGRAQVRLEPGWHQWTVRAPGYRERTESLEAPPRDRRVLTWVLEAQEGTLRVEAEDPADGAEVEVQVDGVVRHRGPLPVALSVPAGWRTVRVTPRQGEPLVRPLEVLDGVERTLTLPPSRPSAPPATSEPSSPVLAAPGGKAAGSALRTAGWSTLGVGLAVLAAGAVCTGLAASERSRITGAATAPDGTVTGISESEAHQVQRTARAFDRASWALYGIGGGAVLTSVVLLLVRPSPDRNRSAEMPDWMACLVPGGVRLQATWGF